MKRFGITREGYEKLKKALQRLKEAERPRILKELQHARGLGDISENAEYEAAKHALGLLETRIIDLESKLARSRIIEQDELDADTALLGATVRLKDLNKDRESTYMLVSDVEADLKNRRISVSSPVGKGLLGAKVGQVVEIDAPAGKLRYQVLEISR